MVSHDPREIELKLEIDAEDVSGLKSRLAAMLGHDGQASHLVSVYYDTPDHDLKAAGVSLRVRVADRQMVQTVKMARGASAGLFDRHEWETVLRSRDPDLKAFAVTPAAEALDIDLEQLRPVFETLVDRTVWTVETASSAIEIALDEGTVRAGNRTQPLAELEVELKRGEAGALFEFVGTLKETASLRPGVQAKSERGYLLVGRKTPRAFKAESVALTKRMSAAQAFQTVIHGCIRHFSLNAPLVIVGRAPEPLHQARVALRRLRSALSLFQDLVTDDTFGRLKDQLQTVSRVLGDARNLDVYLERAARPEAERNGREPGAAAFLDEMEARRATAYDHAVDHLRSTAFRGLLLDLLEWVEAGPWLMDRDPLRKAAREQPARIFAAAVLKKQRRKVKRKGRHLAKLDPHARHRVRIDAKKLRYAAEFFAGLTRRDKGRQRHAAFVAALEELQGYLGDLNDIQTGHEMALSFVDTPGDGGTASNAMFAAAHVSGAQDARVEHLLERAAEAQNRFVRAKRFWLSWSD